MEKAGRGQARVSIPITAAAIATAFLQDMFPPLSEQRASTSLGLTGIDASSLSYMYCAVSY